MGGESLSSGLDDAMDVAGEDMDEAKRLVLIENESAEVEVEQMEDVVESRRA
jgi:hypothetical protein